MKGGFKLLAGEIEVPKLIIEIEEGSTKKL